MLGFENVLTAVKMIKIKFDASVRACSTFAVQSTVQNISWVKFEIPSDDIFSTFQL